MTFSHLLENWLKIQLNFVKHIWICWNFLLSIFHCVWTCDIDHFLLEFGDAVTQRDSNKMKSNSNTMQFCMNFIDFLIQYEKIKYWMENALSVCVCADLLVLVVRYLEPPPTHSFSHYFSRSLSLTQQTNSLIHDWISNFIWFKN